MLHKRQNKAWELLKGVGGLRASRAASEYEHPKIDVFQERSGQYFRDRGPDPNPGPNPNLNTDLNQP